MSEFVYLKSVPSKDSELQLHDVGIISSKPDGDIFKVLFIRIDKLIAIKSAFLGIILLESTGDTKSHKICDRCFKYLCTSTHFENNRIKKGEVITKRPSCRDCRREKNGINVSLKNRKYWELNFKPKFGEIFSCPICTKKSIAGISKHVLDHNHHTGEVRGYICESCNTGIGRFDDNPNLVENAKQWLLGNI